MSFNAKEGDVAVHMKKIKPFATLRENFAEKLQRYFHMV